MSAQFYVGESKQKVDAIRRRLISLDLFQDVDTAIAIEEFASIAGECSIVRLPRLTERRGLEYLSEKFGLGIGDYAPSDIPLAGALCVANNARHRWILVREEDIPQRQRFTIAHELGHLFLEVEPQKHDTEQGSLDVGGGGDTAATVRMFSRCATISEAPIEIGRVRRAPLSDAELLEVKADHFASELLMPSDGIRKLLHQTVGSVGISTGRQLAELANTLAARFDVSAAAAKRRLEKDFAIVPSAEHHNRDLFHS